MKAIIIGSGIGGMATAVRLVEQGFSVEVFEANKSFGGKVYEFEANGFRFDGGPSLFTMPHLVEELFLCSEKPPSNPFKYQKLEESCRYFWEDGNKLIGFSDPNKLASEIHQTFGVNKTIVLDYFSHIQNIYESSGKIFLEKSLHKLPTWANMSTFQSLLKFGQFDLFRTMNRANEIRLKEPHLVQLFNRFATYNGSNPFRAPGILNVIPWLEHGIGTFYPKGGMRSIANSIYELAISMGVKFHFNSRVELILTQNNHTNGIRCGGKEYRSDIVVSNSDIHLTYRDLLPNHSTPKRILNEEKSTSAVVFYWGMKESFEELGLHNILFSQDSKNEFNQLFNCGSISDDPSIYINISSKMDSTDAPEGCENWFVMVNAPSNIGQDWSMLKHKVRDQIIKKVNRILNRNIEQHIVFERVWDPIGIETDTLSHGGSLYGSSSNNLLAAYLRHPNFSSKIKNLYFTGGSVHPGGGIPLVLLSAKITSQIISDDFSK